MNLNQVFSRNGQVACSPVFDGLETLGFSGINIAEIVCVSPSTISKWRNGYVFAPSELIVFLTLVLASRLLDILSKDDFDKLSLQTYTRNQQLSLEFAKENLEAQEKINCNLPASAVREGAIRFRYWWHTQQRLQIAEIQINAGQANQFLAHIDSQPLEGG